MNKVYVVYSESGEYSDYSCETICVCATQEIAERKVLELQKEYIITSIIEKRVSDYRLTLDNPWSLNFPEERPVFDKEKNNDKEHTERLRAWQSRQSEWRDNVFKPSLNVYLKKVEDYKDSVDRNSIDVSEFSKLDSYSYDVTYSCGEADFLSE